MNGIRVKIPPIDDMTARPEKIFLIPVPTGNNDDHPALVCGMQVRGFSHLTNRHEEYLGMQWIKVADMVFTGWTNKRKLWAAISKVMADTRWSSVTSLEAIRTTEQEAAWQEEDRRVALER